MGARRHERTNARRCALQILYQGEILDDSALMIAEDGRYIDEDGKVTDYTRALLAGVEDNVEKIDEYLKITSENWSLARMPIVDRSILRLATYEMIFVEDVPLSVSINEAVELAKDFGGEDDSPRFVNGVLGKIAEMLESPQGDSIAQGTTENSHDSKGEQPLEGERLEGSV